MNNFEDLGKRFDKYLKDNNLGINETAKKFDFSGSQISNIKNGKVFGVDKLFKILNEFNDIDANWLFRGVKFDSNDNVNSNDDNTIIVQNKLILMQEKEIARLEAENAELKTKLNISSKSTDRRAG